MLSIEKINLLRRISEGSLTDYMQLADNEHRPFRSLRKSGMLRMNPCGDITKSQPGEDALSKYLDSLEGKKKQRVEAEARKQTEIREAKQLRTKDIKRSWLQFALGLLLGWILGAFTAREAITWIVKLFQH